MFMPLLVLAILLTPQCVRAAESGAAQSQWVHAGPDGKLAYKTTPRGDRIMDFSQAGYMGGGVAIPTVAAKKTLAPSGGDDAPAIQAALDEVAKMPLGARGIRGAVELAAGTFKCSATLKIGAGGVVLRGAGSGAGGTTIEMTGSPHAAIAIESKGAPRATGQAVAITDAYVPSGAGTFTVADPSGLKAGDAIVINHPVSAEWVHFMGMDDLVRDGKKQKWIGAGGALRIERAVAAVDGNKLTLDIPLPDALDAKFLAPTGATVAHLGADRRITQDGIEKLHLLSPAQTGTINERHHSGIRISGAAEAWVRDVAIDDTVGSLSVSGSRRVTIERVAMNHRLATTGAAKPADLSLSASQVLFDRCTGSGSSVFYLATMSGVMGPNVMLNCVFHGNGHIMPHMRWAAGLLVDGCQTPEGGIDLMNRGEMGSGHGWTIGWGVAWNCVAKSFVIQNPPGCLNWAIGCVGKLEQAPRPFSKSPLLPPGTYDAAGTPVAPASLYLAQLKERLGEAAVKNIGY